MQTFYRDFLSVCSTVSSHIEQCTMMYTPIVSSTSAFRRAVALNGRDALRVVGLAKVLLVRRSWCLSIVDMLKPGAVLNGWWWSFGVSRRLRSTTLELHKCRPADSLAKIIFLALM